MSDPQFHTVRHKLGEETVTLFTDGVTEARGSSGELFGDARLLELLAGLPGDPHDIVASVVSATLTWQSDDASDDIAVVSFAAR
jgi:sigma-B regulation protein RsbU (phosphoserine phosphatase)